MRLTCPACAASYNVPDAMLGAGRQMRCARCGHDWFATPAQGIIEPTLPQPAPEPEPAPVSITVPPPAPPPPPEPPQRRAGLALPLAWAASLAAVGGWLAVTILWRSAIAEAWPPFTRVVTWFGGTG